MVLMATLTHRSTDCLGGRLHRNTFRRCPSRGVGAARAAVASDSKQPRPALGRQRGRKPRHAAATVQPQKRALENVVILKRGEQIVPKSETAAAPTVAAPAVHRCAPRGEIAERVVTADQCGALAESETLPATGIQSGEPVEKTETAAADGRCPAPPEKTPTMKTETTLAVVTATERCNVLPASKTEAVVATDLRTAPVKKAEAVPAADLCAAPLKKAEVVAAANRIGAKARKAQAVPTVYSGASFVFISPDPCELPIPVAFFKHRGAHGRMRVMGAPAPAPDVTDSTV